MRSERITVGQEEELTEQAMYMAEQFVENAGIHGKTAIHVNLLVEEVLGMVKAMVGEFSARFWMEVDANECRIYVDAIADIDRQKKKELLSVSKSGKNVANKGLMSKIGEFFERCLYEYDEMGDAMNLVNSHEYIYSAGVSGYSMMSSETAMWSLARYHQAVIRDKNAKEEAKEAWDEMEKSIIANIADDVIVGVKENHVTLTVIKKIA